MADVSRVSLPFGLLQSDEEKTICIAETGSLVWRLDVTGTAGHVVVSTGAHAVKVQNGDSIVVLAKGLLTVKAVGATGPGLRVVAYLLGSETPLGLSL
jgi:hypothetical protein